MIDLNIKAAIVSLSGKVGKTSVGAHCLSSRIPGALIYAIESTNETAASLGLEVEKMGGDKFAGLFKTLLTVDSAIVDVGASNVEMFLDKMIKIDSSHEEFDVFLVPVTDDVSLQRECIKTVKTLNALGIPAEKIKIVFNRVKTSVEEEFAPILNFANREKMCIANPNVAIFESEVFSMLSAKKLSMGAVLADTKDYRGLLKDKTLSKTDKNNYSDLYLLRQFVVAANKNMDAVFAELFES